MSDAQGTYAVCVPLMNLPFSRSDRERYLRELRALSVRRVFLAMGEGCALNDRREAELAALRDNCAYLKASGFTVGAWFWALMVPEGTPYMKMTGVNGKRFARQVCPTDADYRALMGAFLRDVAACGVDEILFDDDFRCGFHDYGFGCCCENHRALIGAFLGEPAEPDALRRALLAGGKNRIRSAFLQANGKAFEDFAAVMRRELDQTAPQVRMGFCACITSWGMDGTHPDRISRALAGNTRPFYRMIAAPYWAAMRAWGNRLGDVIEMERAEAARRNDPDVEILSEGDTFPRPRFATPASYLECFDTALRAAGCTDGILKYIFDYSADADYETGYCDAARRNLQCAERLEAIFAGKETAGIRVYDAPQKYETLTVPPAFENNADLQNIEFSASGRFAVANSLPTVYAGTGVGGIAFGEDARALTDGSFSHGIVLDLTAAQILTAAGVDVGLLSVGEAFPVSAELFADGCLVGVPGGVQAKKISPAPGAEILSRAGAADAPPFSYAYRNAVGRRFLVFAADGYLADQTWFRGYRRAAQLRAFFEAAGEKLPAFCPGHPELYLLIRRDGRRAAVGLWNLFPDPITAPVVDLDRPVRAVTETVRCTVEAEKDRLRFSEIPAFGFAAAEVEYED